jgi:hypothetical protein
MSGIFSSLIFNNAIFNVGDVGVTIPDVIKTGTGGIDPGKGIKKRKTIFKPTGLVDRKKDKIVEQRVIDSREIQREVFEEVIRPQLNAPVEFKPIQSMTSSEVDREIAFLMKEKLQKDEEEEMMMLMMML